jgi:hypothetical protein
LCGRGCSGERDGELTEPSAKKGAEIRLPSLLDRLGETGKFREKNNALIDLPYK